MHQRATPCWKSGRGCYCDQKIILANKRAGDILGLAQGSTRQLSELWVHPEDGERLKDAAAGGDHIDDFATELEGHRGRFFAELAIERITYSGDDCVLLGIHDARGATLLLVTHDRDLALRADARIMMRDGRVIDRTDSGRTLAPVADRAGSS